LILKVIFEENSFHRILLMLWKILVREAKGLSIKLGDCVKNIQENSYYPVFFLQNFSGGRT